MDGAISAAMETFDGCRLSKLVLLTAHPINKLPTNTTALIARPFGFFRPQIYDDNPGPGRLTGTRHPDRHILIAQASGFSPTNVGARSVRFVGTVDRDRAPPPIQSQRCTEACSLPPSLWRGDLARRLRIFLWLASMPAIPSSRNPA